MSREEGEPAGTLPRLAPVRTRAALAEALAGLRSGGRSLALVPTMGFLHEGHLRLVDAAREQAETVALTLFVNPLQFGAGEDLERYPRSEERDLELAAGRGVELAFAPSTREMYPDGSPAVQVDPGPLGERLCGAFRPGHFQGVLTVVARLFGLFRPDVAVFGRKDYQQAVLVKRMVRDLALGVRIHVAALVREADGLAMSSRNAYLSPDERREAVGLHRALSAADQTFRSGETDGDALLARAREVLAGFPLLRPQYLELVHPESLETVDEAFAGAVLAVAAHCGEARLIDNLVLGAPEPDPRVGGSDTSARRAP